MSATTAIHIVPQPNNTTTRKTSLMPMLSATLMRIVRMAARLRRTAKASPPKSAFIRVTSAVSIACAVPVAPPIAMPTSAAAKAGASLIPSPTIATGPCSLCRLRIAASLSAGSNSARTSVTPTWLPIVWAAPWLSPVNMTTCAMPAALSWLIAMRLLRRTLSAKAIAPR